MQIKFSYFFSAEMQIEIWRRRRLSLVLFDWISQIRFYRKNEKITEEEIEK